MDSAVQGLDIMKIVDLTGKRFGYLKVIKQDGVIRSHKTWLCECDCGNKKVVIGSKLLQGQVKSCGCMHNFYGHHQTNTRLYHIWCTMKARCNRKSSNKYKEYGGRGIKLCEEWQSFEPFYEWSLKNGYSDDLSIDRIDVNGNYEPDNCRWATNITQSNNKRDTKRYLYKGEPHTIRELSILSGKSYGLIDKRMRRGWSVEDAIEVPLLGGHDLNEYKSGTGR